MGAWTLFGFHEDGFTSGIRAAEKLGAKIPFEIADASKIQETELRGMMSRGIGKWKLDIGRILLNLIQWIIIAFVSLFPEKGKRD